MLTTIYKILNLVTFGLVGWLAYKYAQKIEQKKQLEEERKRIKEWETIENNEIDDIYNPDNWGI